MPDDETYQFKRCIACHDLLLGDGHSMSCCRLGPLCDTCHGTRERYAHATIVTTADDTSPVTPRTELGKRLRKLRGSIVAGGARLLGWAELEKRDE